MRMTEAMRNELVVAIEDGQIDNATAFARDFAAKHGLNPVTVRTTISRLRRERGLGTQHSAADRVGFRVAGTMGSFTRPMAEMLIADAGDEKAVRTAAAAVARYGRDPAFKEAVDAHLVGVNELLEKLGELREAIGVLSDGGDPPSLIWLARRKSS